MSQPEVSPYKEEQDNRNTDTKIGFFETNGCSDIGGAFPPNEACVTILDVVSLVFSIVTHFLDMGLDINLAIRYYLDGQIMYFAWTLAFIIFPNVVITIISLRMQYQDREMIPENSIQRRDIIATRVFAQRRLYCEFLLLCQMTPVLHYYDSLMYALRSRSYKKMGNRKGERYYYLKMLKEDQDIALLRVFECFLEAAPQQILQITIFLRAREERFSFSLLHQAASVISSLISMGWAMASYHRNIRLAQLDKTKIDIVGTILQFLWHFFVTVSRIISVSVIASVWPLYTAIGYALHWIAMTSWLVAEPYGVTEFCRNRSHAPHTPLTIRARVGSLLFACVLGIVYLFTYLNPTEGRTFLRHLFYYIVCLFENVLASMLWAFVSTDEARAHWFFRTFVALCIVPFLFGIAAMISYYKWFHPSTKRKTTTTIMLKPS
ncbi:XK-related protein 6 [Cephus cinctus]|uniref:XK-related protein n=1 Tax=Cephus cinctus TaxID=211228 RepID=A0AAJ7BZV8_CEPCN|nr:XK-related protein 6 [Cephus cinctus]XP_015598587.1 XK-related protein 6 [Cephus cinctus]XP_024942398.1 XK-related protein 6 [Cephus cinctus]XP_024942399.1 XK-related protein 6 [Cephus cinctus]XP_024942400.1 XK-related protein 6 [Cephus cinctus]